MLSLDFYLNFPWHKMSPQQKKLMLMPLMRSQKLSVLSGHFFEVDRNLLVYVSFFNTDKIYTIFF